MVLNWMAMQHLQKLAFGNAFFTFSSHVLGLVHTQQLTYVWLYDCIPGEYKSSLLLMAFAYRMAQFRPNVQVCLGGFSSGRVLALPNLDVWSL